MDHPKPKACNTWMEGTKQLLIIGFQKCGIFPLDRSAIDTSRLSGNLWNPPPPSSNSSNPNSHSSVDENASLITDASQEVSNAGS